MHIDLNQLHHIAKRGVHRAAMFMGLGVNAADDPELVNYRIRGFYEIRLLPDKLSPESIVESKLHFRQWIIGNGLTELLHNYSLFLDEVYSAGLLFSAGGKGDLIAKATPRVAEFRAKTSLASKLRLIFANLGLESPFRTHFYGFTKARNALIHANGVVLPEHCDDGKEYLSLAWPGFEIFGRYPDGREIELAPNLRLEAETEVFMRIVDRNRVFRLKDVIRLEPADIAEICLMVQRDSDALISKLTTFARAHGVSISEANPVGALPPIGGDEG